jgi:hypothetical protein
MATLLDDQPNNSRVAAQKAINEHRNVKPWRIELPNEVWNVNEVTRRATRDVDPTVLTDDRKFTGLLIGSGLMAASIFIAAYEFNWIEVFF